MPANFHYFILYVKFLHLQEYITSEILIYTVARLLGFSMMGPSCNGVQIGFVR
jgi:hypothetical protein